MRMGKYIGLVVLLVSSNIIAAPGDVTTVVGGGINDGAVGTQVGLSGPWDVTVDAEGNLYVADWRGSRVWKWDKKSDRAFVMAGNGIRSLDATHGEGGLASLATLRAPTSVAVDRSGVVYFSNGDLLRRITHDGLLTTMAGRGDRREDGVTAANSNEGGRAVFIDGSGDFYISTSHRVRKIDGQTMVIQTVAGDSRGGYSGDGVVATQTSLNVPYGVFVGTNREIYFADQNNQRIRKVNASDIISTIAGNGVRGSFGDGIVATAANLNTPRDVYVDGNGNVYFSDVFNHCIRRINANGIIATIAGTGEPGFSGDGGMAVDAQLYAPIGLTGDGHGNLYFTDRSNQRIRKIDAGGIITTVMGGFLGDGGDAEAASLNAPTDVFVDHNGDIFISDKRNNRVRKVDGATSIITTVAGGGEALEDGLNATSVALSNPTSVCVDGDGHLYIADTHHHRIRRVDGQTGIVTTVAGTGDDGYAGDGGLATEARLNAPEGLFIGSSGDLYIADTYNHRVRKVDGQTGVISTVAGNGVAGTSGNDGQALNANLNEPRRVIVNAEGDLYIADTANNWVRMVDAEAGVISVVAGSDELGFSADGILAREALIASPQGLFLDGAGNLFISEADEGSNRVRKVDGQGIVTSVAGNFNKFYNGDGLSGLDTSVWTPRGLCVDQMGHVYIADLGNNRIRKVEEVAVPTTLKVGVFMGPTNPPTTSTGLSPNVIQQLDVDESGAVDFPDFLALVALFGKGQSAPDFDTRFDTNDDGVINFNDFLAFAQAFGRASKMSIPR